MNIGSLLLFGLSIMLIIGCVPVTIMMMAFSADSGKATRCRMLSIAALVVIPTSMATVLCIWAGWTLM